MFFSVELHGFLRSFLANFQFYMEIARKFSSQNSLDEGKKCHSSVSSRLKQRSNICEGGSLYY